MTITLEELRRATALLEAIVAERGLLADLPEEDRRAFLVAAGRASRPDSYQERHLARTFRRRRRERVEAADREARAGTGIRAVREAAVFTPPPRLSSGAPTPERELEKPRACYVCKVEFRRLHHFYEALCPACAAFNYEKRFQTADLTGRVALVTGARVKIGFQTSLKILRAGARVIATTRFPNDAARRYAMEADFPVWRDRLSVHGLDLRHAPSVELFARYVEHRYERLDVLVNNACQTVRRPPGFYEHLLPFEEAPFEDLPAELRPLLAHQRECVRALEAPAALPAAAGSSLDATGMATWQGGGSGIGLRASARLSQVRYAYDDAARRPDLFPDGHTDVDLQQVDLRSQNSWRLRLAEVPTPEMIEVQLVNAVAPFILCSRLKALMLQVPARDKHIVNVSAMEGIFSRGTKTDRHPHTNMAKAALNMLTLTSARDYVRDGIHMNAVDTGWVTDEDPALHATRKREELDFQPPLDIVDGAARICDPFFAGLRTGQHLWGQFLKDYKPSPW
jgi:NAD(P)-dependent dehydrogenase (short-subunit alcohol dehydrogenase family)